MSATVRAKMKCNSITKSGSAEHPNVSIQLGAIFSADPESENRSFANATPSGSLHLNIDAGRPAANAFELGGEYYIDIIACGVPERRYLKDELPPKSLPIVLSARDGTNPVAAQWDQPTGKISATIDGKEVSASPWTQDDVNPFLLAGLTHWAYEIATAAPQ